MITKELFALLEEAVNCLKSIASDLGYFADKARKEDAREAELEKRTAPAPVVPGQ